MSGKQYLERIPRGDRLERMPGVGPPLPGALCSAYTVPVFLRVGFCISNVSNRNGNNEISLQSDNHCYNIRSRI